MLRSPLSDAASGGTDAANGTLRNILGSTISFANRLL
jgi:hypothetical protein